MRAWLSDLLHIVIKNGLAPKVGGAPWCASLVCSYQLFRGEGELCPKANKVHPYSSPI